MTGTGSEEPVLAGEAELPPERRGITRRESLGILISSVVAAASALGATVLIAKALTNEEATQFLSVFWAALFGIYGIVAGIQQETTRAVGAAALAPAGTIAAGGRPVGARVAGVAAIFGLVAAVLVALTSLLWAPQLLPTGTSWAVTVLCIGVGLYAMHSAMSGAAAGLSRWYLFAGLGGGEAAWRIVAMAAVAISAASLGSFEAAAVSPVIVWILFAIFSRRGREAFDARADVGGGRLARNYLFAMGSSTGSAVLMTGFPLVMAATHGLNDEILGALTLAIGVTRSPIMIPLQAFQGVAIAAFLRQRHRPLAAMSKPAAALLGVGLLGALLAWAIGPWLYDLIYRDFSGMMSGPVLGLLTFGSAVMALLVLSGTATLALNAHRVYTAGWVIAALTAIGLLFLPMDLIPRALVALYVGPAVGFAVHLAGMVAVMRHRA
ncbi:hypothetical protein NBM05_10665 [Rothia sp. AR01]|uniref:Uncharacterized protein n=1 Tax=Rothia santali TaxID=2949643 RepID=A0A9X2HIR7_9MICC|nr:hypothetical protein [Rothia santali]MCP3426451.1 hypothetical protein [Rothia santali]